MYHAASSALLPSLTYGSDVGSVADVAVNAATTTFTYNSSKMRRIASGYCAGQASVEERIENGSILSTLPVRVYESASGTQVSEAIFLTVQRIGVTSSNMVAAFSLSWVENTP